MNKSKIKILTLRNGIIFLIVGIVFWGLIYASRFNYLLFHTAIELVTILIGFGVFIFAWNVRQFCDSSFFIFIGISFLFVSSIDLIHTLAYEGMNIFRGFDSNLPTQLWIAARYLQSISFIIAFLFLNRKLKPYLTVLGYFLITVLLVFSIFLSIFPDCYIMGSGLTDFKIASEYIISLFFIIATALLIKNRKEFDNRVLIWIVVSFILMVGGEIAFTFYISTYGLSNLIGHIFKLVSFYFIYLSIIETGLKKPFDLINRNLVQTSMQDSVTGLYNRIFFNEELNRLERGRDYPISLIMVDVDGLKIINDTYGHQSGDLLLKQAADVLVKSFRGGDVVARIGGDEFAILLPNADVETANKILKRIVCNVEENNKRNSKFQLSISCGASTAESGQDLWEVLRQADDKMYEEKRKTKLP